MRARRAATAAPTAMSRIGRIAKTPMSVSVQRHIARIDVDTAAVLLSGISQLAKAATGTDDRVYCWVA
jgi:hypothetical protein